MIYMVEMALHEVDSPEIFSSHAYRANGGPSNTGEWQVKRATGTVTCSAWNIPRMCPWRHVW